MVQISGRFSPQLIKPSLGELISEVLLEPEMQPVVMIHNKQNKSQILSPIFCVYPIRLLINFILFFHLFQQNYWLGYTELVLARWHVAKIPRDVPLNSIISALVNNAITAYLYQMLYPMHWTLILP
jgi:hypothetical protein